mgnify:CR=1 FL=1
MSVALIIIIILLIPALLLLIAGLIQFVADLIRIDVWIFGYHLVWSAGDALRAALGGKSLPAWLWDQLLYGGFVGGTPKEPTILTIYWWRDIIVGAINWIANQITTALNSINITIDYYVAQVMAVFIIIAFMALIAYAIWRLIM